METQTLKINIPQGFEIDGYDKATNEIKIREKPKNVIERIKTINDVLVDHSLTPEKFDKMTQGLEPDEVAYIILKMLAASLNEGWKPSWDNSSEIKWYPCFDMRGGSSGFRFYVYGRWTSGSGVGSRLCFKTKALAEYAGKQFVEVYKQFMTL